MKSTLLDIPGTALAVIFGSLLYYFGGMPYLALMLIFLSASVLVTKYEHQEKRKMGIYEHERSWENVLANGIASLFAAILSPTIGFGAFVGSIAAITADKFASELGVLSGEPYSIFGFKRVKRGTSGAVSPFGTLMSFDGALLIAIAVHFLFPGIDAWRVLLISLIGFSGSLIDTVFGVLEEEGIGSKATTNLICALTGALLGYFLLI